MFSPVSTMQIMQQPMCPNKASSPTMKRKHHYYVVEQETERQEVSTELTISCEFHGKTKKPRTTYQTQNSFDNHHAIVVSQIQQKISAMKYYTKKEEQEDKEKGVSTKLKLYIDPWKIKKKLTISDLGQLSRLLVKTELIKNHVLPFLSADCINQIESKNGKVVVVWDQDTMFEHQLILKLWHTSKSYVLIGNCNQEFVKRRELKEGDEIGLYWDPYSSRFNFTFFSKGYSFQSS